MKEDIADIGQLIEPTPVGFSFDAPGWYVLIAGAILLVITILLFQWRKYVKNKFRRDALVFIQNLEDQIKNPGELVNEVNILMKRMAIRFSPREKVAFIPDESWRIFLNQSAKREVFTPAAIEVLKEVYSGTIPADRVKDFVARSKKWIKIHHASISKEQ